jgi:adenosine/AMP kinase
MELTVVPIVKPDAANFIFGQSHFIKTVEDLHEALVGAVPVSLSTHSTLMRARRNSREPRNALSIP